MVTLSCMPGLAPLESTHQSAPTKLKGKAKEDFAPLAIEPAFILATTWLCGRQVADLSLGLINLSESWKLLGVLLDRALITFGQT